MERYYKLYTALLESEELYEMFKGMTGEWLYDKDKFIKEQEDLEAMALGVDLIDYYEDGDLEEY
jgi:hypothetical protein